jgi:hypothetical protein
MNFRYIQWLVDLLTTDTNTNRYASLAVAATEKLSINSVSVALVAQNQRLGSSEQSIETSQVVLEPLHRDASLPSGKKILNSRR